MTTRGFIAPTATIRGTVRFGSHVVIDDEVLIYQDYGGGPTVLGDGVRLQRNVAISTGHGGSLTVGDNTSVHRDCHIEAYVAPIHFGRGVTVSPRCAFYSFDHGMLPDTPINSQPLQTKGGITLDDDAWLGYGVIVLSGVRIGKGAVVGAGSVVTRDVPDGAIAVGAPARIVKTRDALISTT